MTNAVRSFVALGSNLGDRLHELERARRALRSTPGIRDLVSSRIYQTAPVGPAPQGPYLNAVVAMTTPLPARELLAHLLDIERAAGRRRGPGEVRWGARTLDLDLLLHGDQCTEEPALTVPHPRLHERGFVLEPLCELASEQKHPLLGKPLATYAARCRDREAVVLCGDDLQWSLEPEPSIASDATCR